LESSMQFFGALILTVFVLGFLYLLDMYWELKDLRRDVRKAIQDIERVMPKATHSVKTEVLSILKRLKC